MLSSLSIKNYALINEVKIDFSKGFSIITGETGAGKSILLGALGLLQGKRADLSVLNNADEKCVVEGVFQIKDYQLHSIFESLGLDYEDETIIRREILPSNKSRAFINDTPVVLSDLQTISSYLIDIHSQFQTAELFDVNFQLDLLDALSGSSEFLLSYRDNLKVYKTLNKEFEELSHQLSQLQKEQDYQLFLLNELEGAQIVEGEQSELESELNALTHVESVLELLSQIHMRMDSDEVGVVPKLTESKQFMHKIALLNPVFEDLLSRLEIVQIEVKDIAQEIHVFLNQIEPDPQRLEKVNDRLSLLMNLQKKHMVSSESELLEILDDLKKKNQSTQDISFRLEEIASQKITYEDKLITLGKKIHSLRESKVGQLVDNLEHMLGLLGIQNARFKIGLSLSDDFMANGMSDLEFLFSANKGGAFGLLNKTASGGELSRIMLSVKAILSKFKLLPTIIFDEIDTGVSGEIADKMALIMKEMSGKMQVISITHLPQIAAKGNAHYKVQKQDIGEKTISDIRMLSYDERVEEIAQMFSGNNVSEAALSHAKALLG